MGTAGQGDDMHEDTITVLVAGEPGLADAVTAPSAPDLTVVGHVATGHDAVAAVLESVPDVVLLDARIEDPEVQAVCGRVREWVPASRVVAVCPLDDERAYTAMVAGAAGVVLHGDDPVPVLRRVVAGEAVVLPRMALRLIHDIDAWAERSADPIYPPPTLTATEREVLARIGEGTDPAEIAALHGVTTHLVNVHAGFAVAKLHRYVHGVDHVARHRAGGAAER